MALQYSQWMWGFEVVASGSSQNNMIDLNRAASNWAATTAYTLNAQIDPSGASASSTQLWKCTTAGTSGGSQPAWPASPTAGVTTVTDGTVTWTFLNAVDSHAAVAAGVYSPDELAAAVATAMNAADAGNSYTCSFSYSTLLFTVAGTNGFDILWSTGANHSKNMSGLLGFDNTANSSSLTSYSSAATVGTAPTSTAFRWTAVEPNTKVSPVSAQSAGTAAQLTQRRVRAIQNISDGMTVETIYFGTLKKVAVEFRALTSSEQTNMEAFLDWVTKGKRVTWQPDKTSTGALKLVLASPNEVNGDFEWLTRSEITYGTLNFFEQLS